MGGRPLLAQGLSHNPLHEMDNGYDQVSYDLDWWIFVIKKLLIFGNVRVQSESHCCHGNEQAECPATNLMWVKNEQLFNVQVHVTNNSYD